MHAVVFCHNHAPLPQALTDKSPLAMMPVGDVPLLQRLVESLVRGGVASVTLVVAEGGYDVSRHFGAGVRWGVPVDVALERAFVSVAETLGRLSSRLPERYLACARLVVTDIDARLIVDAVLTPGQVVVALDAQGAPTDLLLLDAAGLAALPHGLTRGTDLIPGVATCRALPTAGLALAVDDLPSYFEANMRWVRGEAPLAGPADATRLGRRCRVDRAAALTAPASIGQGTSIGAGCRIGPDAIIGESVIVDDGAEVVEAVVWPGAYIGRDITVHRAIVAENLYISPQGTLLVVPDAFILGGAARSGGQDWLSGLLQQMLAALGLAAASPILVLAWLVSTIRPGVFVKLRKTGQLAPTDLQGGKTAKPVEYRILAVSNPVLRHLPALWDVVRGELRLVGVEPLDAEEAMALIGSWQDLRFSRPPGLIHPWHAMGLSQVEPDE